MNRETGKAMAVFSMSQIAAMEPDEIKKAVANLLADELHEIEYLILKNGQYRVVDPARALVVN